MQRESPTAQRLHEDHVAVLALLDRLDGVLASRGPDRPAGADDGEVTRLAADLIAKLDGELAHHFDFEEKAVFPRLYEAGEGDMAELLVEEHGVLLPLAAEILELLRARRDDGFPAEAWRRFHRLGLEFAERQRAHIEKEEIGLLPAIAEALEPDIDGELAMSYAEAR